MEVVTLFHWYTSPSAKLSRSRPAAGRAGRQGGREAGRQAGRVRGLEWWVGMVGGMCGGAWAGQPAHQQPARLHTNGQAASQASTPAPPPPPGALTLGAQLDGPPPELALHFCVPLVPPPPPLGHRGDDGGVVHHLLSQKPGAARGGVGVGVGGADAARQQRGVSNGGGVGRRPSQPDTGSGRAAGRGSRQPGRKLKGWGAAGEAPRDAGCPRPLPTAAPSNPSQRQQPGPPEPLFWADKLESLPQQRVEGLGSAPRGAAVGAARGR